MENGLRGGLGAKKKSNEKGSAQDHRPKNTQVSRHWASLTTSQFLRVHAPSQVKEGTA